MKNAGLVINQDEIVIGNYRKFIHDRLKRLIFTPIGESIGVLDKGSHVPEMMYNLNDDTIAGDILSEVELIITLYEPLIELISIEVKTEETETYAGVLIKIDFYYSGTTIKDSLVISEVS